MGRVRCLWCALAVGLLASVTATAEGFWLPVRFEENKGQFGADISYMGWAGAYMAEMRPSEVVLRGDSDTIHMRFAGAGNNVAIQALDAMVATTGIYDARTGNFYEDVRNYKRLRYSSVYPGVDVVFRGGEPALEFDFVLQPRADYRSIAIEFVGQKSMDVLDDRTLLLKTPSSEMRLLLPAVYQETPAGRKEIIARYHKVSANQISFDLGPHDPDHGIVIDPQIVFGTYIQNARETPQQLVMGPDGQANVLYNVFRESDNLVNHLVVARFNAAGSPLAFFRLSETENTFFTTDFGFALAVDSENSIAVIASVQAFGPNPPYKPSPNALPHVDGSEDILLIKFGKAHWASYLGGSDSDVGKAIVFDAAGNLYVTGSTHSRDFPTRNGFQNTLTGVEDAFLTKINPMGTQILYSTYLGGRDAESANSIALDAGGNIYLAGWTQSSDFPTASPIQPFSDGTCDQSPEDGTPGSRPCADMFVAKFNPAGTALIYSTLLGVKDAVDVAIKVAVTPDGYLLLLGSAGQNFPLTSTIFTKGPACCPTPVLLKLDKSGSRIIYSMRFPANDMATDAAGDLFVVGSISPDRSFTVPLLNSTDTAGIPGVVVTKFDTNGSLGYSTIARGASGDLIGADAEGIAFVSATAPCNSPDVTLFAVTDRSQPGPCSIISSSDPVVFVVNPANGPDRSPRFSRIEENYPQVKLTSKWYVHSSPQTSHSGGSAVLALDAGERFTINFTGTAVKWFGCRDEWAGIAKVTLDGTVIGEIDTFMTPGACGVLIWSKTGLSEGNHTLIVDVTGKKNSVSNAPWVWLDVLEITSNGDATFGAPPVAGGVPTVTRVEQTDKAIQYTGSWYPNGSSGNSGGSATLAQSNASATFSFSGTGVRWLGLRDAWAGIANVYVDGVFKLAVDTYSVTSQYKAVLFAIDGLSPGNHTLKIEATGRRNPGSAQSWIWIDALEWTSSQ